jgi:hypothetical protein
VQVAASNAASRGLQVPDRSAHAVRSGARITLDELGSSMSLVDRGHRRGHRRDRAAASDQ